ncbi:MAG: hypothetical protein MUF84_00860 [Anaerolineae bacterium]|nr:hypothetical protein [Anaerolineae bacterium]
MRGIEMHWDESLTQRQRVILLALALSVIGVVSMLAWSVWSASGAAWSEPSPAPTPFFSTSVTPAPTSTVDPTVLNVPTSTPEISLPAPAFDVFRAGYISAEVAAARQARTRYDTPLTLVDELDMARALYAHYRARPPLPMQVWQVLNVLGLWSPEPPRIDIVAQAELVASLYAPETAELYLRRDWDGQLAVVETQLAFGFARAYSDNYGDLAALQGDAGSIDRRLAIAAVAQGDAVVSVWLANGVMPAQPGSIPGAAAAIRDDIARASCPRWRGDAELLSEVACLDLDLGVDFLSSRYWAEGTTAMDAVVLRPPRSTEQVLHPDRYAIPDEPLMLLPIEPALGPGWTLTRTDTLGEALMGLVVKAWSQGALGADAVTGWGGDLLQVWQGPESATVWAWQLAWDDSRTAASFYGNLLDLMPRALVKGLISDTTSPASLTGGRWWSGRQGTIYLYRCASHVWLVSGDDPAVVRAVAEVALP